jgi:16S rRNA (guanine527-N7)-methyltransferase
VKQIHGDAGRLGIELNAGQAKQFADYQELLQERAFSAGLIANSDRERLYERHLLDSLRAASVFRRSDRLAYDLGSGAGLPGIVLAIALPGCRFVLAETRPRRAGFLELATDRLGLGNVAVHAGRAESLPSGADVITARAFASLERTWSLAAALLRSRGRLIYFAGAGLLNPELVARSAPGPPRRVRVDPVLETSSPLVMMTLQ